MRYDDLVGTGMIVVVGTGGEYFSLVGHKDLSAPRCPRSRQGGAWFRPRVPTAEGAPRGGFVLFQPGVALHRGNGCPCAAQAGSVTCGQQGQDRLEPAQESRRHGLPPKS